MTETKPTYILLKPSLESASVQVYQCRKKWEELKLKLSGHENVRFCDQCKQDVHQVVDLDGFRRAIAQGRCVMVSGFEDVNAEKATFVGKPEMSIYSAETGDPKDDAI